MSLTLVHSLAVEAPPSGGDGSMIKPWFYSRFVPRVEFMCLFALSFHIRVDLDRQGAAHAMYM